MVSNQMRGAEEANQEEDRSSIPTRSANAEVGWSQGRMGAGVPSEFGVRDETQQQKQLGNRDRAMGRMCG